MQVFNYKTKNFDICPEAIAQFTKAVAKIKAMGAVNVNDREQNLQRAAAKADQFFAIEKAAIAQGCHDMGVLGAMELAEQQGEDFLTKALEPEVMPLGSTVFTRSFPWAKLHKEKVKALPNCVTAISKKTAQNTGFLWIGIAAAVLFAFYIGRKT